MNKITKAITIKSGIPELGLYEKLSEAWVLSRTLAEMFDKRHDHVLRDIEEVIKRGEDGLLKSEGVDFNQPKSGGVELYDDFNIRNFIKSEYKDKKGEKRKEYLLNRKSFVLIAMGFTGDKALEFKKMYIEAFETMTVVIQTRLLSKEGYKKMTDAIKDIFTPSDNYYYAREADMINKAVLGMTAKQFREVNQVDAEGNTRDLMVKELLNKLNEAQLFNANMIRAGMTFEEREKNIKSVFGMVMF